jgi:hypothetical protein
MFEEVDRCGGAKVARLEDNWDRDEFSTRTDVVRQCVYDVGWYCAYDEAIVLEVLTNSTLFDEWQQGSEAIQLFNEVAPAVNDGFYSGARKTRLSEQVGDTGSQARAEPSSSSSNGATDRQSRQRTRKVNRTECDWQERTRTYMSDVTK